MIITIWRQPHTLVWHADTTKGPEGGEVRLPSSPTRDTVRAAYRAALEAAIKAGEEET